MNNCYAPAYYINDTICPNVRSLVNTIKKHIKQAKYLSEEEQESLIENVLKNLLQYGMRLEIKYKTNKNKDTFGNILLASLFDYLVKELYHPYLEEIITPWCRNIDYADLCGETLIRHDSYELSGQDYYELLIKECRNIGGYMSQLIVSDDDYKFKSEILETCRQRCDLID